MNCYKPITAWKGGSPNKSGKTSLVFTPSRAAQHDAPIEIPCGQCIGCRLRKSKEWAIRCMHEAALHEDNCFITLTFNDQSLWERPNPGSIDVRDLQLFLKRLRKNLDQKVRFFACGEYGETTARPHYHILIFGWTPQDGQLWKINKAGHRLYTSPFLEKIWGQGHCPYGEVTADSAAYTARYSLKKITGESAQEHYQWQDKETGDIRDKAPEFATMSRRPGIAREWLNQYGESAFTNDFVIIKGKKCPLPKYYDRIHEILDPIGYNLAKEERQAKARETPHLSHNRMADMHYSAELKSSEFQPRDTQTNDETNRIHCLRQQSKGIPAAVLHAKRRDRNPYDENNS